MQMSTPANIPYIKFEKIVIWTATTVYAPQGTPEWEAQSALDYIRPTIMESPYVDDEVIVLSCDSEDYDYKLVQVARPKFTPVQEDSQATVTMDTLNDTMDKLTDMAESMKGGE